MYLPTVISSHKESTIGIDYERMIRLVQNGNCELLLVKNENVSIAGMLIITNGMPRLWAAGIRESHPIYRKQGATAATYVFSSQYLSEEGFDKMHMGMSRGFLSDGVLRYKNKWNHEVIGYDTKGFVLKPLHISDGLKGFLMSNPYVYLNKGKLYGAVFVDSNKGYSIGELKQIQESYYNKGLAGIDVFSIDEAKGVIYKAS
jgi:hypothetical protein